MCGIAGVALFARAKHRITAELLLAMNQSLAHRGPDGEGIWLSADHQVGFAHRRLSIIDISPQANQPMHSTCKRYTIVFNGEIYNHVELKRELIQLGLTAWQTHHADTEVILNAYRAWGKDCLHKFRGMFAFALWDNQERTLWLVRDRLGVKPLYYTITADGILFGSEIKAILQDRNIARELNEQAFFHYLSFLTSPAPDTLFKNIHKIPAGSWLAIDHHGQVQQHRYWDLWQNQPSIPNNENELCAAVLDKIKTAVHYRKVSDVPVGVFLSGGIDSSLNTALFSEGETKPVHSFSIGYDQAYASYQSELPYARLMAKTIGTDHHEVIITEQDLLDFLPQMIHLQDEPIADPVCVPVYYVAKLAKSHGVTVCQVGEGADELFCGYPGWQRLLTLQHLNELHVPKIFKQLGLKGLQALGKAQSFPYEWLHRGTADQPVFWGGAEAFTHLQKIHLLSDRLKKQFHDYSSWEALKPIYLRYQLHAPELSPLNWMSYLDLNLRLPELLLMRVDKMCMGASLEARVPFLDHELVEFVMQIPSKVKFKNSELKYLLKKSIRGIIPDQIIHRPKQGFGVPIHEWFFSTLGHTAREKFVSFATTTDIFDKQAILGLLDSKSHAAAWYIFNFILWWEQMINPSQVTNHEHFYA